MLKAIVRSSRAGCMPKHIKHTIHSFIGTEDYVQLAWIFISTGEPISKWRYIEHHQSDPNVMFAYQPEFIIVYWFNM